MRRLYLYIVALAAIQSFTQATATQKIFSRPDQSREHPFTPEIDDVADAVLQQWLVPGMSIAVVSGEETYFKGYGFASFPDTPVTRDTLWHGGSTTKAFLAASLAVLINNQADHRLAQNWSTPISSLIRDDFVLDDIWATNHLTLEDAVSHRTGMPRHDFSFITANDSRSTRDTVRNLRNLPLRSEPRTLFQYCNLMYLVLTHVVETLTGQWFGDYIQEALLHPIGLTSTVFDLEEARSMPNPVAVGYLWDDDNHEFREVPQSNMRHSGGAGAIISTIDDYATWIKFLMNENETFSKNLHDDIRKVRMVTTATEFGATPLGYSLGWFKLNLYNTTAYYHSGATPAFGAEVIWFPDEKLGIVGFANAVGKSNSPIKALMKKILDDRFHVATMTTTEPEDLSIPLWQHSLAKIPFEVAADDLFPDRPKTPLPAANLSQLCGTYRNAGYGELRIEIDEEGQGALSGLPIGFSHVYKLQHVSGDYWVIFLEWSEMGDGYLGYFAGRFTLGVSGQASALEITFKSGDGPDEGVVIFERG